MNVWFLLFSPAGCPSGDTRVCSIWDSREKAETAIVALSANPDNFSDEDDVTTIDSPFAEEMCDNLEIWIEEMPVQ